MTEKTDSKLIKAPPDPLRITDPHNVPVIFAHHLVGAGHLNGIVNMTLGVARFSPTPDGAIDTDMVVAARLRMDMACAMQMRDQLDRIIGQAETAMKQVLATAFVSSAAPGTSGKPS